MFSCTSPYLVMSPRPLEAPFCEQLVCKNMLFSKTRSPASCWWKLQCIFFQTSSETEHHSSSSTVQGKLFQITNHFNDPGHNVLGIVDLQPFCWALNELEEIAGPQLALYQARARASCINDKLVNSWRCERWHYERIIVRSEVDLTRGHIGTSSLGLKLRTKENCSYEQWAIIILAGNLHAGCLLARFWRPVLLLSLWFALITAG